MELAITINVNSGISRFELSGDIALFEKPAFYNLLKTTEV